MADPNEFRTRKDRIDPILDALGWKKQRVPNGPYRIEEYETDNGPADYALCCDGRVLGIVEAKRLTLGPQNALTQAERYSRGATANPFDFAGLHVPFLYSTNGEVIWFHDIRCPRDTSRRVACFHSPAALLDMLSRDFDGACAKLNALPHDDKYLWSFQIEANKSIEDAICTKSLSE